MAEKKENRLGVDPLTAREKRRGIDDLIRNATQDAHTAQNAQVKKAGVRGSRGNKLPRINMAFDLENIEYLRVMAAGEMTTATAYVNKLIEQDRQTKAERYAALKQILGEA